MKLIDILVMISKGELKEGTTFKDKEVGAKIGEFQLNEIPLTEKWLNEEYELIELIEPSNFNDDGKVAEEIEELDIDSFTYGDEKRAILKTAFKLNEVIRRINNVR